MSKLQEERLKLEREKEKFEQLKKKYGEPISDSEDELKPLNIDPFADEDFYQPKKRGASRTNNQDFRENWEKKYGRNYN